MKKKSLSLMLISLLVSTETLIMPAAQAFASVDTTNILPCSCDDDRHKDNCEKEKKETKKRERKSSAPKEKKTKTGKAANEVSSNSAPSPAPVTTPASTPSAAGDVDTFVGQPCPLCGKGTIIKGKTAYGCSEWRNGCTFRKNF